MIGVAFGKALPVRPARPLGKAAKNIQLVKEDAVPLLGIMQKLVVSEDVVIDPSVSRK